MHWTGRGVPRVFCPPCRVKVGHIGEWAEEPGGAVVRSKSKMEWQKAFISSEEFETMSKEARELTKVWRTAYRKWRLGTQKRDTKKH